MSCVLLIFSLWLLNWEFADTVLLMLKDRAVFAVSAKKAKLLRDISVSPTEYFGPRISVVEVNPKVDTAAEIIAKLMVEVGDAPLNSVSTYLKDKEDCDLTREALSAVIGKGAKLTELKEFMDLANVTKTKSELGNLGTAGAFTEWAFSKIVTEIEEIIETDKLVKHSAIQRKIEGVLDTDEVNKFAKLHAGIDTQFLDFPLPVLIQSGGDFHINKFQLDSSAEKLKS